MNGWPDRIFEGVRGDRRRLGDHPDRRDHALVGIMDVGRVVIEGRHRADHAAHHRHRVRVAPETLVEARHLLVDHGVARDAVLEVLRLLRRRQLAVEKQVGGLQEVAVLGQLVDRIAAVEEHALVAVDEGDRRGAGGGGGEAGIVGEAPGLFVELADVDDLGAGRASEDVEIPALVADRKGGCLGVRRLVHGHLGARPPGGSSTAAGSAAGEKAC